MFTVVISVVATAKVSLVALTVTTEEIVVLDFEFGYGHQSSGIVVGTDVSLVVKALHGLGYSNLLS